MKCYLSAVVVLLALVFGGCSQESAPSDAPAQVPAAGATVDAATFKQAITLPDTVILDVRTPAEFAAGHLAGATNIDVEAADFSDRISGLDKAKHYAVYCRSANRSQVALNIMQGAGFTSAYHLGGGIQAWTAAGYPVEQG